MKLKLKKTMTVPMALLALSAMAFVLAPQPEAPFTGHGNQETLSSVYKRWKNSYESRGGAEVLQIGLNYSRAQSLELTDASGQAALNLLDGRLQVVVKGLSGKENYDVWLMDNHTDKAGNKAVRIGALAAVGEQRSLNTSLDRNQLASFTLDAIAVAKAGETPETGGLLFGTPGLLQRVYYNDRFIPVASIGSATTASQAIAPFAFLLPKVAAAKVVSPYASDANFAALIAEGEKLFTKQTFGGNGRTCSTCHRPDNNHTIDPAYIAKLPQNDPLFVAENYPQLAGLENPKLLRQFGLFVANIDGFDRPPVLRSASHLLGIANSLTSEKLNNAYLGSNPFNNNAPYGAGEFQEDEDFFNAKNTAFGTPPHAIGWSGDGAPDGGTLRDFAKGAIIQHLPKSLGRVAGKDFRFPTDHEMDALEAYMLSLGRSEEVDLTKLSFKSPLVQNGLLLFNTKNNPGEVVTNGVKTGTPIFGTTGNCNGCHSNAGAISSTTGANPTRDTGVERMRDQLHHLVDPSVAYDGGFGQEQQNDCGPQFNQTCFSDGSKPSSNPVKFPTGLRPAGSHQSRFNTPSLIEAADTGPFFHNNSVTTLEETVAYYNTDAFNNSPGAFTSAGLNRQGKLDSSQVIAVALFLRSINVLENIRSSSLLDQKAIGLNGNTSKDTVKLAMADTADAIEVLQQAVINPYPEALKKLQEAWAYEDKAVRGFMFAGQRKNLLQKAINLKSQARDAIVTVLP